MDMRPDEILQTLERAGFEARYVGGCVRDTLLRRAIRVKAQREQLAEEVRVLYVALTRARERLFLSHASRRMLYNQIQFNDRSRFIDDIPARLIEDVSDRDGRSGAFSGNKKPGGNWQSGGWQQPAWSKSSGFAPMQPQAGQSKAQWAFD